MPVGDPADPLYAPFNKTGRPGLTAEDREAVRRRMTEDTDNEAAGLRQENLNKLFAEVAALRAIMEGARGDFPIKVSTGQNGSITSIDPSALKGPFPTAQPVLIALNVNGDAGYYYSLATQPPTIP